MAGIVKLNKKGLADLIDNIKEGGGTPWNSIISWPRSMKMKTPGGQ